MKTKFLSVLALALVASASFAQTKFILRYTESEPLSVFLARYNLDLQATVASRPIHSVVDPLGRDPQVLIDQISNDTDDDVSIELDQIVKLPILDFPARATQNLQSLALTARKTRVTRFFGSRVTLGFVTQPVVDRIAAPQTWSAYGGGAGIVAVIDTGIDPNHPVFTNGTVPGVDFLDPTGNGSEFKGLSGDVLALVNPTTTPLLSRDFNHLSNGHAPAWEPGARLNTAFNQIPIGLGHGTMVAGAIRLVAPYAKILAIRAFSQDGTGRLFHVIAGIHAAEDRGARVVNLSLNTYVFSPELEKTVNEVSDRGLILVASTGNDGLTNPMSYPARFQKVTSVASVDFNFVRSSFSNAGADFTWVAAPGEALYLPFPGKRYAGGWGTSFAAPLVSGMAVQMLARKPGATYSDLQSALGRSRPSSDPNLGLGTLHVFDAISGL